MTATTQQEIAKLPDLPEPAVLRQPGGGELVCDKDGDEPYFWAWISHGYDTGMEPFFDAEQMREYARSAISANEAEVLRLREALTPFANMAYFPNIVEGFVITLDDSDQQAALQKAFIKARAALSLKE
jgi:hypothetical protein